MTEARIRTLMLDSGLCLEFFDRSNRYFGDYHRVRIEVDLLISVKGRRLRLRYQQPLQRMGVPSANLSATRDELIERFLQATLPYMQKPHYAERLLASVREPGQKRWSLLSH